MNSIQSRAAKNELNLRFVFWITLGLMSLPVLTCLTAAILETLALAFQNDIL